jgi:drug/metabolite transporter (DMT)-like permease
LTQVTAGAALRQGSPHRLMTAVALAMIGAVLFSANAIIVKLAYRHGADPVSLVALRMLFAMPLFALMAWWAWKRQERGAEAEDSVWQPGDVPRVIALGLVGYYLASFLDFLGLQYITAGLGRIILYLNPTLVLLISFVWLGRPIARREWVALAVAYTGVVTVYWHDLQVVGSNVPLGSFLVFVSAVAYAIYLVAGGTMVKRLGPLRLTAWSGMVSCVACIAQALVLHPAGMFIQVGEVYWLSLINGVFCTALPIFLVMTAIDRIGAGATSQLGMIGPVSTLLMGAYFLAEPLSATQLSGTAIVLAGVAILSVRKASSGLQPVVK